MNTRPSAMRVPSPSATIVERPAPVEMQAMSNNLPAVTGAAPIAAPSAVLTPSPTVANIAQAISAVMSEIGVVTKDGQNKFQNYKYAKMEDILQQLTPLIGKNGLAIIQTELDRSMFDNDSVIAVRYAFTIMHKSGDVWPERPIQTGVSRCRDSKGGFDDKALNKAHTAARKYFLLALFQIPTGDEDDADRGEASTHPPASAPRRAPSPVPSPTGKVGPHAVSTDGEKVQTWAPKFMAYLVKAETLDELTTWETLNDGALNMVYEKAPLLYDTVLKAFETRRAALTPAVVPQETKVPVAPPVKSDIPSPTDDPEGFFKWVDAELATCTDYATAEALWNEKIEPAANGLFPPDFEHALGIWRKHENRLAP